MDVNYSDISRKLLLMLDEIAKHCTFKETKKLLIDLCWIASTLDKWKEKKTILVETILRARKQLQKISKEFDGLKNNVQPLLSKDEQESTENLVVDFERIFALLDAHLRELRGTLLKTEPNVTVVNEYGEGVVVNSLQLAGFVAELVKIAIAKGVVV